jgi:hypothetical protein
MYSGDYATVTERECNCLFGQMGMTTHLSGIRSYEKLTGEGVTFIGSLLFTLVEEVLPSQFGGQVNDYQLVEEEGEEGIARVSVIVSPRVGTVDEKALVGTVLDSLATSHHGAGGDLMSEQWRQGQTLRILRQEPEENNGKIPPLRLRRARVAAAQAAGLPSEGGV